VYVHNKGLFRPIFPAGTSSTFVTMVFRGIVGPIQTTCNRKTSSVGMSDNIWISASERIALNWFHSFPFLCGNMRQGWCSLRWYRARHLLLGLRYRHKRFTATVRNLRISRWSISSWLLLLCIASIMCTKKSYEASLLFVSNVASDNEMLFFDTDIVYRS
jgi:hypothetical protein